jgi:hypothetical protein
MSAPGPNPLPPSDDSTILANFMPNRAHRRIWRTVAVFCFLIGALMSLDALRILSSELDARLRWSRANARVAVAEQKSADENHAPGGSPGLSIHTVYWVEFEVDFNPANGCRTGISASPSTPTEFPCTARIRTLLSGSPANAYYWVRHHPQGGPAQVLYDPKGPGVRFADESLVDLLPWSKILASLVILVFSLVVFSAAQRRLRDLAYLPADQDLPAPPSSRDPKPDDLIDLKLS